MPRVIAPWDTPVPESLLGVLWMAEVLYPGESDLTLSSEIERFYTDYYDYTLTEEELAHLTSR
jgi:iron complex transport system substrate-binding protein